MEQTANYRSENIGQIMPEVRNHRDQAGDLYQDIKNERLYFRQLPTEQIGDKHKVGGAGNGQEFCKSLNDAEQNGLKKVIMMGRCLFFKYLVDNYRGDQLESAFPGR